MARDFGGDATRMRDACVKQIARALSLNPRRWSALERRALENWSLVLSQVPDFSHWLPQEKEDLAKIIRSQLAANEMQYLRRTQAHPRLRATLLHLGAKP
jgi:hypothetical protein